MMFEKKIISVFEWFQCFGACKSSPRSAITSHSPFLSNSLFTTIFSSYNCSNTSCPLIIHHHLPRLFLHKTCLPSEITAQIQLTFRNPKPFLIMIGKQTSLGLSDFPQHNYFYSPTILSQALKICSYSVMGPTEGSSLELSAWHTLSSWLLCLVVNIH